MSTDLIGTGCGRGDRGAVQSHEGRLHRCGFVADPRPSRCGAPVDAHKKDEGPRGAREDLRLVRQRIWKLYEQNGRSGCVCPQAVDVSGPAGRFLRLARSPGYVLVLTYRQYAPARTYPGFRRHASKIASAGSVGSLGRVPEDLFLFSSLSRACPDKPRRSSRLCR